MCSYLSATFIVGIFKLSTSITHTLVGGFFLEAMSLLSDLPYGRGRINLFTFYLPISRFSEIGYVVVDCS